MRIRPFACAFRWRYNEDAMRSALKLLIFTVALAACHKQQPPTAENHEITVDENLAAGQLPPNADIETLPPDESSVTSNGELVQGEDNPDVNSVGNSH
jgi:hypothetical protein